MKRTISELYQADYSAGPPALITRQNRERLAPFVLFDAGSEKRESQLVIDWHPHSIPLFVSGHDHPALRL